MAIAHALLPEFDNEMKLTRKVLERFPAGKGDWKPHDKSMPLGRLAGHLAECIGWTKETMEKEKFVMDPSQYKPVVATSAAQILEYFDKNVKISRDLLSAASDEAFLKPWEFVADGKTLFTMPRIAVVRNFVMNHTIHHRAQLGVYYRLLDVPVPSIYGPSADEQF